MNKNTGHSDPSLEFLYARLDQVRMSGHERLHAEASLAQAEAFADLMFEMVNGIKRLLKILVLRPIRRLTSLG